MTDFKRYAVHYAPPSGPFADFASAWLGWDAVSGSALAHPDVPGLPSQVEAITATPRKYGFHGTLKPPFRLAQGSDTERLKSDIADLAAHLGHVKVPGLALQPIGSFLALVPDGDSPGLAALAAAVVSALDNHRAPPGAAELARRRAAGLSLRQETFLTRWGYPYVMEEFRFHLTLTGKLPPTDLARVAAALEPVLAPILPRPFKVQDLCLFGEDREGRFHLLRRYALSG